MAAARALTGLALAAVASAAALATLAARTGIEDPGRVAVGTFMFAVIYLAIGARPAVARGALPGGQLRRRDSIGLTAV
jgi:hypothetical protein